MSDDRTQPLILISGLSGSGKSVALNALEDHGYYCVDNLPGAMLPALAAHIESEPERYRRLAVGIDARAGPEELARLPGLIAGLARPAELIFLTAENEVLIRRFSETRRRHPLGSERTLGQAIEEERRIMEPLAEQASHVIDTSDSNIHELRRSIRNLVKPAVDPQISSLVLESFAFKKGVPRDVDLVFDARCLPNPHWQPDLRACTGLEQPVGDFLGAEPMVEEFADDVDRFVRRWLPVWAEEQRSHLTIAIGCTGGKHRSVYLVDRLAQRWRAAGLDVTTHHRELIQ
ncbi:MAG: RNase adapter RapZ [Wenzhouxiangellaceae bacterium]|nr:RNase adapter RapZ [Wenzhouxiangellaceae bacterium]